LSWTAGSGVPGSRTTAPGPRCGFGEGGLRCVGTFTSRDSQSPGRDISHRSTTGAVITDLTHPRRSDAAPPDVLPNALPTTRARGQAREAYVSQYAELSRRVQAAGLQRRRYGYYWACFSIAAVAFVTIWIGVALLRDSWLFLMLLAGLLAVVSAQLGFLGHDAAHRQVFASAAWNEWAARVISAFAGLSYGWWLHKHNRHHSGPNQEGRDPDIGPGPIAFTPALARTRTGWAAALTRWQGVWFFLLLPLEGLNLHAQSIRRLLGPAPLRLRAVETVFLVIRLGGYLTALFLLLPAGKAAGFICVNLALFGILLGGAFAPNHIGMPIVPADARPDFLRRQVLMSRNIRGRALTGFFMGGLNHQIEHHLFPSMPRPGLKQARALVRAHCLQHQVEYTESTLPGAYRRILRYLNAVGLRDADPFRCPLITLYR
jgi:fatty acid desaturase